jgi:hypothetical protein
MHTYSTVKVQWRTKKRTRCTYEERGAFASLQPVQFSVSYHTATYFVTVYNAHISKARTECYHRYTGLVRFVRFFIFCRNYSYTFKLNSFVELHRFSPLKYFQFLRTLNTSYAICRRSHNIIMYIRNKYSINQYK